MHQVMKRTGMRPEQDSKNHRAIAALVAERGNAARSFPDGHRYGRRKEPARIAGVTHRFRPDWVMHVLESPPVLEFYLNLYLRCISPVKEREFLTWSEVLELSKLLASNLGATVSEDGLAAHFSKCDTRKDGKLSMFEFKQFFRSVLASYLDAVDCERACRNLQIGPHDNLSDLMANTDWLRLLLANPGTRSEVCRERFEELETDASGQVSWTEAQQLFHRFAEEMLMPPLSQDELMSFYSQADVDRTGKVDFHEFETALSLLCGAALQQRHEPVGYDWKVANLRKRFPDVGEDVLYDVIRECSGHGGHAVKMLRKMGYHDDNQPPPIYGKRQFKFDDP